MFFAILFPAFELTLRKKKTTDADPKIYLSGIRLLFFNDLKSFSVIHVGRLAEFLLWEADKIDMLLCYQNIVNISVHFFFYISQDLRPVINWT